MPRAREQLELPVRAIAQIARRVGAHAGLNPPEWVVAARVRDRLRGLGVGVEEYLRRLAGEELAALTEALRVGETRFFRHRAHVGALRRVVVPDLAARCGEQKKVRAWSAGCATGEEAYTLAILLMEGLPEAEGWDVEVLGTDISEEALTAARLGRYPAGAVDPVPAGARDAFFSIADGGQLQVRPELARRVRFERRNLLDPLYPRLRDLILCRNVLIYFEPEARVRTVERLIESLVPGGYLFLGYAESLRQFENLEALRTEDGVVYRRPIGARRKAAPTRAGVARRPPARAQSAGTRRAEPKRAEPVDETCRVVLKGTHEDADAVALDLRRAIAGNNMRIVVDLDGAEFLADGIAQVLKRAEAAAGAAGVAFLVTAKRPGPRRWLARHGLERAP